MSETSSNSEDTNINTLNKFKNPTSKGTFETNGKHFCYVILTPKQLMYWAIEHNELRIDIEKNLAVNGGNFTLLYLLAESEINYNNEQYYIISFRKDKFAGMIRVGRKKDTLWLTRLHINKKYKSNCLCVKLVQKISEFCQYEEMGNKLQVEFINKKEMKCYRLNNFKRIKEKQGLGVNYYVMQKVF